MVQHSLAFLNGRARRVATVLFRQLRQSLLDGPIKLRAIHRQVQRAWGRGQNIVMQSLRQLQRLLTISEYQFVVELVSCVMHKINAIREQQPHVEDGAVGSLNEFDELFEGTSFHQDIVDEMTLWDVAG
eukprot:CAMPEP_0116562042 /NCGR_PEP_ID=MMETSP0397-20121206/11929_1 /TAXON_ID=216820 /ORGANISM="Cyclophora tenuis, Strain ECT3854" /LENGTH=128 /DNA_ID=CAMNT_0004088273 /DNA_START=926 /DNA_END=1309 /DNA_ORIENTATION=-